MAEVDYDFGQDILYLYKKRGKAKFSVEVIENFVIEQIIRLLDWKFLMPPKFWM